MFTITSSYFIINSTITSNMSNEQFTTHTGKITSSLFGGHTFYTKMQFGIIAKLVKIRASTLNLIFIGIMIGGSFAIMGSLYLIYDSEIFGNRTTIKTDMMIISFAFSSVHVTLTNISLMIFKKMRHTKVLVQKEKNEIARIDRAKDEFAAMAAHELKTPVVPILSYSKMLLQGTFGELSDLQKEKLKIIVSGTESLLTLIQDILDVHKAELGKMKCNFQFTDINVIVKEVIAIMNPIANVRGTVICNAIAESIKLDVDKGRIKQVLTNLIKNAIDFVQKETGIIEIKLELETHNAILSVSDNGCGIPKEEIGNLFKKFYQIDSSQTRERGGTGIGLAICKSIIELHSGKIWAESEVGKGTTIRISLPIITRENENSEVNVERLVVKNR